jgi:hypothetical protein
MKSLYFASVLLSCLALLTYLIICESAARDAIQVITVRIVGVCDGDSNTALAAGNPVRSI